jgi:hypothetical protein
MSSERVCSVARFLGCSVLASLRRVCRFRTMALHGPAAAARPRRRRTKVVRLRPRMPEKDPLA